MNRDILHIDMDAFFVSVEEVYDPSLKGKPVVVGGDPGGRGVVAAASYEARKYGIHSAMPVGRAKRLCPQAIFVRGSYHRYSEVSTRLFQILESYSPLVEPMSLDEGYVDLTGCARLHKGPAQQTAMAIHYCIRERLGVNASIGMGSNKLMGKVASGLAKPNGFLRVLPGAEGAFLAPLPIGRIPGVGPKSQERFRRLGIRTIRQLATLPLELLEDVCGDWGVRLYQRARGQCESPVFRRGGAKSISRETTFDEDTRDRAYLLSVLSYLTEKASAQLRSEQLRAQCVTLKLRFADFNTITRSCTLEQPASEDHILFSAVTRLLNKAFQGRTRVRLVGVALTRLTLGSHVQLDLFESATPEHWDRLYQGIDRLRSKYGFDTVLRAQSNIPSL